MANHSELPRGVRRLEVQINSSEDVEGYLAEAARIVEPYSEGLQPWERTQFLIVVLNQLAGRTVQLVPDENAAQIAVPMPGMGVIRQ